MDTPQAGLWGAQLALAIWKEFQTLLQHLGYDKILLDESGLLKIGRIYKEVKRIIAGDFSSNQPRYWRFRTVMGETTIELVEALDRKGRLSLRIGFGQIQELLIWDLI